MQLILGVLRIHDHSVVRFVIELSFRANVVNFEAVVKVAVLCLCCCKCLGWLLFTLNEIMWFLRV
jgi:hypothetical protein